MSDVTTSESDDIHHSLEEAIGLLLVSDVYHRSLRLHHSKFIVSDV